MKKRLLRAQFAEKHVPEMPLHIGDVVVVIETTDFYDSGQVGVIVDTSLSGFWVRFNKSPQRINCINSSTTWSVRECNLRKWYGKQEYKNA